MQFLILLLSLVIVFLYFSNKLLRKKVQENIIEKEKLENYLDIAQVLIMVLDKDKNVVMINKKGAEIVGCSKKDIIGKNWIENFLPKRIRDEINRVGNDITQKPKFHSEYENPILRVDGEERLILWKNSKMFDDYGNVIGILTSGEDITEKKQNEQQLLLHTKQAQMGEMISMIAHQWRQPLSAIASTTIDMKMKDELEMFNLENKEELKEYQAYLRKSLDSIDSFVQNLTNIIDDFRNFYKQDKKKIQTTFGDIIEKSLNIIVASLNHNAITLIKDCKSNEKLDVYDGEMMQVILNILKNAEDNFIQKGIKNRYIKISTSYKTLSISDNGGGIPDDIINKVFDPYFSTKHEKNGTGLGLYMSKIIINDHHNGNIKVENIINEDGSKGVCFTIEL